MTSPNSTQLAGQADWTLMTAVHTADPGPAGCRVRCPGRGAG